MRTSRLDKAQGHLSPLTIASLRPLDPPGSIPLQYASHQELGLEINKLRAGLPASELRDQLAVPFKVLLLRHLRAEFVLIGRGLHFYIYLSRDPTGWGPVMSIPQIWILRCIYIRSSFRSRSPADGFPRIIAPHSHHPAFKYH